MRQMKDMPYIIGVKIRIYPSNEQKQMIAMNAGAARFVYNALVARDRESYALRKTKCYVEPVARRLEYLESLGESSADLKAAYLFLDDKRIDAQAIANAVQNYHAAWSNFKKVPGASIPAFHKKGYAQSYQTSAHYYKGKAGAGISGGNVRLADKDHILLPKLKKIRFKDSGRLLKIFSRGCETRIGTVTIEKDECGDYYASLQVGSVCPFHKRYRKGGGTIGIDVNIKNFYTDSNGGVVENPKYRKAIGKKLAKAQHRLSRMAERAKKEKRALRDSKNYQKQRLRVAKFHKQAAGRNEAFQHILSKNLVKSQDRIFAEDLKIKDLMHGSFLAKAIADCAWGSFLRKLEYKSRLYGKAFLKVPERGTTQTCSQCGYELTGEERLTLADRQWDCPKCGTHHDRDWNAAVNIKKMGLQLLLRPCL